MGARKTCKTDACRGIGGRQLARELSAGRPSEPRHAASPAPRSSWRLPSPSPSWLQVAAATAAVPTSGAAGNGVAVSATGIRALARTLHQPIYWVGTAANVTYERTLPGDGRVVLRYLPSRHRRRDEHAVSHRRHLHVPDAYAATQRAAAKTGAVRIRVASSASAIAFSTTARPLNAWITYPGSRYQIEVFDPEARAGAAVRRVGERRTRARQPARGSSRSRSRPGASPRSQRPTGARSTGPAPLPNRTYELTKTSQGGYPRPLPGARIGARRRHAASSRSARIPCPTRSPPSSG